MAMYCNPTNYLIQNFFLKVITGRKSSNHVTGKCFQQSWCLIFKFLLLLESESKQHSIDHYFSRHFGISYLTIDALPGTENTKGFSNNLMLFDTPTLVNDRQLANRE